MRVRVAGPDDATVVTALRAALRVEESPASPDTSRRRLHAYTRLQLMSLGQVFFLAERGGRTIGLLRCALQFQGEAQPRTAMLTTAYVLPAHRRRGVMRQLVDAAAAWSASHGVIDLRLRNAHDNTAANAAWEALGFSVVQVVRQRVRVP
jgi:GNAT superfamily N-acetyltransferase